MLEAKQSSNPVRLLMLSIDIKKALDAALAENPADAEVRLDLVRYYMVTPRIAGGSIHEARAQAEKILALDRPLGHFARGYIAYREKQFGAGRIELRESIRTAKNPETKRLAMQWLGWLSQESQQWNEAFAIFTELKDEKELRRTEEFCRCKRSRVVRLPMSSRAQSRDPHPDNASPMHERRIPRLRSE